MSGVPQEQRLFVDGAWIDGASTTTTFDRWSGAALATVHQAGAAHVGAAVDAASRALARRLPVHERAAVLERAAELVRERAEEFAAAITSEIGKPIAASRTEVERAVGTLRLSAEEARRPPGETVPLAATAQGAGTLAFTVSEPRGVVAAITPFNFPLNLVVHKLGPAIAAGCPIVFKPSDRAPLTAGLIVRAFADAGLPAGFLNLVMGPPQTIVPALLADDRVAVVTFTGSSEVGWSLKAQAPRKHFVLELGSNTAMVVMADADLDEAVAAATASALGNSGQACISLQRVYVERSVAAEFERRLTAAVGQAAVGDPWDPRTVVGPLVTDRDAERLQGWIGEAQSAGARVAVGGTASGGILSPTVVVDPSRESRLIRDEAFGPVVSVIAVADLEEALDAVNDSRYGLNTAIYTRSLPTALAYAERAQAGSVLVNMPPAFRADHMPYGGVKDSGDGREGVKYAIEALCHQKLIVVAP